MALFKIRRGLQASYDALTSYNDGHLYVCTDTGNVYAATSDTNSVQLCVDAKTLNGKEKFVEVVTTGTVNGTILVDGVSVPVAGLKSAAFTEASAYATAAQGALADTAVQPGVLTSTLENYLLKADKYNDSEVKGLISDNAEAIEGLQETVKNIQENAYDDTELKNLINGVKETAEAAPTVSEVDSQIDTKITALNLATTYEPIGEAQKVVDALKLGETYEPIGAETKANQYTDQKLADFVAAYITADGGAIDKLTEIASWIADDEAGAAKIISDVNDLAQNKADKSSVYTKDEADGKFLTSVTKEDLGLGNVENKSSADIRSEIDASNVTTALGYAPVNPSSLGDLASKNESSLNLGQYAKTADLGDLATKNESSLNLGQYAKSADLKELAYKDESELGLGELAKMDLEDLNLGQFVKSADLATVLVDLMGWGQF